MLQSGDRILITGASGQVGCQFQSQIKHHNSIEFVFPERTEIIIHESDSVKNAIDKYKPNYFVNCAAYTAVDKAESESAEAYLANGDAPGIMAQVCKESDVKFIHISTDYVFDGLATVPYKEDNPTMPQSVYGASKLEGEKRIFLLNQDAIIIRTSWLYSEFRKNFVKTMLQLMQEKEEIGVVSDQTGSPTYVTDLVNAIMTMLHSKWQAGTFHFCNTGAITWYDFAVAIQELSGLSCNVKPITTLDYPTAAIRPPYSVLDTGKIKEAYGIEPRHWKDSLRVCLTRLNQYTG